MNQRHPPERAQSLSELYPPKWLHAPDLQGKTVRVTITSAAVESFRQPDGSQKPAVVLGFHGTQRRLICNKTQAEACAAILGSERFTDWVGKSITLVPGLASNNKATIVIGRAAQIQNGKDISHG